MENDYIGAAGREGCCAFTGHRSLGAATPEEVSGWASEQIRWLYYEKNVRVFLTGGALGFDTVAAEAVLRLRAELSGCRLAVVIPCRDQDARWSAGNAERYRRILARADQVTEIARTYRNGCMLERDRYLVDHAGWLITYYDGRPSGGTAYTVRYAEKNHVTILPLLGGTGNAGGRSGT